MLACTKCQAPYGADSIDLSLGVAYCGTCGHIDEMSLTAKAVPVTDTPPAPKPPRPPGWQHAQDGSTLILSKPWRSADLLFLGFFTVFWDGIIGFMLVMALAQGETEALILLATPHTWIGVGLAYYVVAMAVNRTTLRAGEQFFTVRHGPLPWFGNRCLERSDIEQFYVVEAGVRVNRQARWTLSVIDATGLGRTAIRMLKSPDEARWLEYQLEQHMGIKNRHVPGEI